MSDKSNIRAEMMKIDRSTLLSGVTLTMAGVPPGVETAKRIESILENVAPLLQSSTRGLRSLFRHFASGADVSPQALDLARLEWEQGRTEIRQVTLDRIRQDAHEAADLQGQHEDAVDSHADAPRMTS